MPRGQPPEMAEILATLLAQGLDLCVRARNLDEQFDRALQAGMGRIYGPEVRCATPALWVQEQYDTDLAEWEARARKTMMEMGYAK